MTASSSARRAREPLDRCDAAAGHRPVVVLQAPAPPHGQRRQRSTPTMDDVGIDRRKSQRHRIAFMMAQHCHKHWWRIVYHLSESMILCGWPRWRNEGFVNSPPVSTRMSPGGTKAFSVQGRHFGRECTSLPRRLSLSSVLPLGDDQRSAARRSEPTSGVNAEST